MSHQDFLSMIQELLPSSEWQGLEQSLSVPLSKSISVCGSRMSLDQFFSIAKETNWQLVKTPFAVLSDVYYVSQRDTTTQAIQAIGSHLLHQFGFCYIQEVAASIPAHFVDMPEQGIVLDMCAAPGGKSVQLAQRVLQSRKQCTVRSNDPDAKRLPPLVSNTMRTGSYNVLVSKLDGTRIGDFFPEMFDSILLDAPCSGEGTAFKSDDALKWRRKENIMQIAGLQRQLLQSALQALKPGGSLVYSTCTLNTLENEENITRLLQTYGDVIDFEPLDLPAGEKGIAHVGDRTILTKHIADGLIRCRPHKQHTGGFFVAKIRKHKSIETKHTKKNTDKKTSHKKPEYIDVTKDIILWLKDLFGMQIDPQRYIFRQKHDVVYIIPSYTQQFLSVYSRYHIGIPIAKGKKSDYRPLHGLGIVLGEYATTRIYVMYDMQALDYTKGKDLRIDDVYADGWYILQRRGQSVSVGKLVNGMMKNKIA